MSKKPSPIGPTLACPHCGLMPDRDQNVVITIWINTKIGTAISGIASHATEVGEAVTRACFIMCIWAHESSGAVLSLAPQLVSTI